MEQTEGKPQRVTQIEQELDRLRANLSGAERSVEDLSKRLVRVSRPTPPPMKELNAPDKAGLEPLAPLADTLRIIVGRLAVLRDRLADVSEQLEC